MTSEARETVTRHAERAYPNECVGALLGHGTTVHATLELENASSTPRRAFELTAREYLRAEADATARGLELLGFYHSHPDAPAEPSARDRELLGKFAVNVIIEVRGGVVTGMTTWSGE